MKSKVLFLGIVTSGIASVFNLFDMKIVSLVFAAVSLILLITAFVLRE